MKKIYSLFAALFFCFSLFGCSGVDTDTYQSALDNNSRLTADLAAANEEVSSVKEERDRYAQSISQLEKDTSALEKEHQALIEKIAALEKEKDAYQAKVLQAEAAPVIEAISGIHRALTLADEEAVQKTQALYDALSDDAKQMVENKEHLSEASAAIQKIKTAKAEAEKKEKELEAAAAEAAAQQAQESENHSGGIVYWVSSGEVYHSTSSCRSLSRSKNIYSGSIAESGKDRPCKICY